MKVMDDEGEERVIRHRRQRDGKGFCTIEKLFGLSDILADIDRPMETTVLLECVSNLVGNEMYDNPARGDVLRDTPERVADEIAEDIKKLALGVHNCILVANRYPEDGDDYDDSTRLFVKMLEMVNERIIKFSDKIYEL